MGRYSKEQIIKGIRKCCQDHANRNCEDCPLKDLHEDGAFYVMHDFSKGAHGLNNLPWETMRDLYLALPEEYREKALKKRVPEDPTANWTFDEGNVFFNVRTVSPEEAVKLSATLNVDEGEKLLSVTSGGTINNFAGVKLSNIQNYQFLVLEKKKEGTEQNG